MGTVPGRVRGSGHMVPTYFRRELRDRSLQRRPRLRTFAGIVAVHRFLLLCIAAPRHLAFGRSDGRADAGASPPADPAAHERVENICSPRDAGTIIA